MNDDRLYSGDRLRALSATGLLDSPRDEHFDQLTRLAANILRVPSALVTLISDERQYVKSNSSPDTAAPPGSSQTLDLSFCRHVVSAHETLAVEDARQHPLTKGSGAIAAGVIAYAGVPIDFEGQPIGALCVFESHPRLWTTEDLDTLRALARSAMRLIEEKAEANIALAARMPEPYTSSLHALFAHLRSIQTYNELLGREALDLEAEAEARVAVESSLRNLRHSPDANGGEIDSELQGLIANYLASERRRGDATRLFAEGKIALQELQALIMQNDGDLTVLRLAALDRGAEL